LSNIFDVFMSNHPLSRAELLEILESVAQAQLQSLRALRRKAAPSAEPAPKKDKSNMEIVYDLLRVAPGPLHINEIIEKARQTYGLHLSRESLVSALTKKVLDQHTFRRTAPNTFDLIQRPPQP
jgi:hypothetical protein